MPDRGYLLFDVRGTVCALPRSSVRELLPVPRLWRSPGMPRPVVGFMDLGGEAVPVLALDRLLGLAAEPAAEPGLYSHLLILATDARPETTALLVDRVLDFVRIPAARVTPAAAGASLNGCVIGQAEIGDRLVPLLDADRILLAEERQSLAALRADMQARLAEWKGA